MNGFPELVYKAGKEEQVTLAPNGNSLDLLRAVYRNPALPLPVRMRAAGLALPHEVPRLAVTAVVNDQDFASLLERAIQRTEQMETKMIEAKPVPPPVKVKPVKPHVVDRRYRRV